MDIGRLNNSLSREQKTGFVLLLVFAILAIGLGFLQMRNNIHTPFVNQFGTEDNKIVIDENTRLQQIDTDQDGISDYDELQMYGTSPYLPDTDSDGFSDYDEIKNGTDPNCAEGKTCTDTAASTGKQEDLSPALEFDTANPVSLFANALDNAGSDVSSVSSTSTGNQINNTLRNPVALRDLLLKTNKITEAELNKIDDATLLNFAQQILKNNNVGSSIASTTFPVSQ